MAASDVLIVGAGPAGSIAATVLARAGVRVRLIDRAVFPRDKLCGDTVNPGTLSELRRLGLAREIEARGVRVEGMRLTGENGASIEARYPGALHGRALVRRDLDSILVEQAVAAGAQFDPGVPVRRAVAGRSASGPGLAGVVVSANGQERELRAPVTLAADGRRSTLAFSLGLARHPQRPKRWAIGAYYQDVIALSALGEMHMRADCYIGVAPVPGGLANVCLVKTLKPGDERWPDPAGVLRRTLSQDPALADRFAGARLADRAVVMGPLAVDVHDPGWPGLLLAGDAAGFIDPMTGDGLRFAVRGGVLAANAALEALERGWDGVHERLSAARRSEFRGKRRFNRTLRALTAWPGGVRLATRGARLAPRLLSRLVATAGDCGLVTDD